MKLNTVNIPIYRAFGLNIQSELPETKEFGMANSSSEIPDAIIRFGSVPPELINPQYNDIFISASPGTFLLKIKGVARYLICNGSEIIIEKEPSAKEGDVATFAFGSALGVLLYQRNVLVLHGSAVRTAKGAVLFTGIKGAGKSTTASALSSRGWEFMSDDVCAIYTDSERPILYPGLSRAKLTIDSFSQVLKANPSEPPISPVLAKYGVSFKTSSDPSPLHAICMLNSTDADPYIEEVIGTDRLSLLTESLYRPQFHSLIEAPAQRFTRYINVSSKIKAYRVFRSKDFKKMNLLLEELEDKILL